MAGFEHVDGESFLKNMVLEIMNNNDIVHNEYKLIRNGNNIDFYGNGYRFSEVTEVIDDGQLKEYYDQLSTIFNDDFEEFIMYGDPTAELLVIVNGKVIYIDSDNKCDEWIFEKKYGKKITPSKAK